MRKLALASLAVVLSPAVALAQAGQPGPMKPPPAVGAPAPGEETQPGVPGTPAPQTGAQLSIPLAGTWRGTMNPASGLPPIPTVIIFKDDQTYIQWMTFVNGFTVQIWGTYNLSALSPTSGMIMLSPAGWTPRETCPPGALPGTGVCRPIAFAEETHPLTVRGPDAIQFGSGGIGMVNLQRQ